MNKIKLTLFFASLFAAVTSFAQQDPTSWRYEVKKKGGDEYQVVFHLALQTGWHIWSLKPGGDGFQIAPSFTFDSNPLVKIKGAAAEKGQPITTTMDGVDGKVTYFSGNVDYTQDIIVKGKTKIKGKHTYQVCNDRMCLPPKDKEFAIDIN